MYVPMPQLSNKMNAVCTVTASKFLKNIEFIMHCFAKTSVTIGSIESDSTWAIKWEVHEDSRACLRCCLCHTAEPQRHSRWLGGQQPLGGCVDMNFGCCSGLPGAACRARNSVCRGLWRPKQWWGPPLLPWCRAVKSSKGETDYVFPRNQDF